MSWSNFSWLGAVAILSIVVDAQFPPKPAGITVLNSHVEEGVRISYKEVRRRVHHSIFEDF